MSRVDGSFLRRLVIFLEALVKPLSCLLKASTFSSSSKKSGFFSELLLWESARGLLLVLERALILFGPGSNSRGDRDLSSTLRNNNINHINSKCVHSLTIPHSCTTLVHLSKEFQTQQLFDVLAYAIGPTGLDHLPPYGLGGLPTGVYKTELYKCNFLSASVFAHKFL